MAETTINQDTLFSEEPEVAKKMCGCGHSNSLPYCDGGHKTRLKFVPLVFDIRSK